MRLGLLGPALDHLEALAVAARFLNTNWQAERVVYLGADRQLDNVVASWAESLVGPSADDFTIMSRATKACLNASAEEIEAFLLRERQRAQLRMFESLPGERTRSVEIIAGKVAVMLHDKAHLEEEDILPANLLIFGKSRQPLVKQVGRRWFLSPGSFPDHGIMVIDDEGPELRAVVLDQQLNESASYTLSAPRTLRMQVSSES
jgi:hypothetical protein